MAIWDIFKQDAFSVLTLTDAMREIKYKPSYISSLNLFASTSVDTLKIAIDKAADEQFIIVPSSPRGGVGATKGRGRGNVRDLAVPHFEVVDHVYADEVQGKRAFGEEQARESFQSLIARRAADVSQDFALTEEYHRLSVITKGQLLDADGTVLYDYFDEMGEAQPAEINFDLAAASPAKAVLREKCDDLWRAMATTLGGLPFTGILALCGDQFFKDLVKHKEVYDLYLGWQGARTLQTATVDARTALSSGVWGEIDFGNIRWVNYRGGSINGTDVAIGTDKVHFVPYGVPGLFRTVYAPADYIETVNRPGQRLYSRIIEDPNGKRMNLEYQSNVIHYVTRPRVLMRGKRA